MKKYLSSLLALILSLGNFSVFTMQRTIENYKIEDQKSKKFFDKDLSDDVIFHKIFEYASARTLTNLRLANKDYKKKVDNSLQKVLFKDFENGLLKKFAYWPAVKQKKVQDLIKQLEIKLKTRKQINLTYGDKKQISETIIIRENIDKTILKIFDKLLKEKNNSKINKFLTQLSKTLFKFKEEELLPIFGVPSIIITSLLCTLCPFSISSTIFILETLISCKVLIEMQYETYKGKSPDKAFLEALGIKFDEEKEKENIQKIIFKERELQNKKNK